MDRRGRLAQSLKPKDGWRVFARSSPLTRGARRGIARLTEYDPPRGVGSLTAATIIIASIVYGVVAGGHIPEISTDLRRACDALANRSGLRISSVALSGHNELRRSEVLALAGIGNDSSLLCLDAAAARSALKANPWIADAAVLKLYPGQLRIELTEREPLAIWQKAGDMRVIASDGTVLEDFTGARFTNLPQVVGEGAALEARDFLALIAHYPPIHDAVEASVLVAGRRWNMHFKNGLDVKLPGDNVEQALQVLVALDRDKKLLSRDITIVDLRQADRVTVRLSDQAAAARTEAMKELLKKPKKKGSDA
jgi:cell division protein FtsQ